MRDRVAAMNRLIDNFRYRIRRKFLHVKWAYYLVIKLQHALHMQEHTVAHDDDKSSLCSLRQLRFAIMENCRHTSLALCIIRFIIARSWTQIVYSLRRTDTFSSIPLLTFLGSVEKLKTNTVNFLNSLLIYLYSRQVKKCRAYSNFISFFKLYNF